MTYFHHITLSSSPLVPPNKQSLGIKVILRNSGLAPGREKRLLITKDAEQWSGTDIHQTDLGLLTCHLPITGLGNTLLAFNP
jgi:hypothetical protein